MIEAGKGEERTFLLRYWTTSSSSVGWNRNPGGNLSTPFFTSLTLSMDPNRGERRRTKKKKRVRCRKRETWMVCFYKVEDDTNNSFSLLLSFKKYFVFGVNHTQSPSFFWRHFHSNFFFFNHLLFFLFVSQLLFLVGIYLLSLFLFDFSMFHL